MRATITNITEASVELTQALEQLARVQEFLGSFQDILGRLSAAGDRAQSNQVGTAECRPEALTLADRVLVLMREMGRPVQPKAVAAEYERRRWPTPRADTVYGAVNSAMSYLLHRRGVLQRNAHGYFLPDQFLSDSVSGKQAGRTTRA